jgi:OFA family oxalate/formate antiporter-like MFS transporter
MPTERGSRERRGLPPASLERYRLGDATWPVVGGRAARQTGDGMTTTETTTGTTGTMTGAAAAPAEATPSAPPERLGAALFAATAAVLPAGSIYSFSVFIEPLERLLGATRSELAIVFGLSTIFMTVGLNAGPRLFPHLTAPALLVVCAATMALGTALSSIAESTWLLGLGYGVLFGFGGGLALIVVQQGINQMTIARRGLVNGYIVSLLPVGAMLATPLAGLLIASHGARVALMVLAAVMLVMCLAAAWLTRAGGMRLTGSAASGREAAGSGSGADTAAMIGRNRATFWKMFAVFFLAASAGLMVLGQAAAIVVAYGGTLATALAATTGVTAAIAFARLTGGWLTDRFAVPHVMAGAQAFALIGAGIATAWPTVASAITALLTVGMGYGIISGATAGAVARYWARNDYGRVASRIYIAWCAAALVLPVLAAVLFDLTGGYRTAMIVAGGANLAAVLVASTLPRRGRESEAAA